MMIMILRENKSLSVEDLSLYEKEKVFHTCCEFYKFVFDKDNIPSKAVPGTFLNLDMYSGRVAGQADYTYSYDKPVFF